MTDWEPATEAEIAMRDALRVADQELYFRILARTELFLPVSPDALAGRAPMGWGTWNSGGRTHVLAFTSIDSMHACLAEHAGSARRIAYYELAGAWPNDEWWLGVNPGLPIEGYLPPWFVSQLANGDVRMPDRPAAARNRSATYSGFDSSANHEWSTTYGGTPYTERLSGETGYGEHAYQPFGSRSQTSFTRGSGAAAATGARREAARATATSSWDRHRPMTAPAGGPVDEPIEAADEPIEAEMVDPETLAATGAHGSGRSATGRPGTGRRPRRHDATIIDAEIIESTVLGATALDAMVVNATVIDASMIDSEVIDATLLDMSVEDTGAHRRRAAARDGRGSLAPDEPITRTPVERTPVERTPVDRASAEQAPAEQAAERSPADATTDVFAMSTPARSDIAAAGTDDTSPTRPIKVDRPTRASRRHAAEPTGETQRPYVPAATVPPADVTQRIDPVVMDASPTRRIRLDGEPVGRPGADETQRINVGDAFAAGVTQRIHIDRNMPPADETQRIPVPHWGSGGNDDPTVSSADSAAGRGVFDPDALDPDALDPDALDPDATVIVTPVDRRRDGVGDGDGADLPPTGSAAGGLSDSGEAPPPVDPAVASFVPANELEDELRSAVASGQTERFLSTLLLAKVVIPVPDEASLDARLDNASFPWRREEVDGQQYVVVFTSDERMAEFLGDDAPAITAKFIRLIHVWPDVTWAFAVNPGSPIGAMLPGLQIKALAAWADDAGLTDDEGVGEYDDAHVGPPEPDRPVVMQKPIAASHVDYYLERGYDRASGFVHRATEVMHLQTPADLIAALGLAYSGSSFRRDAGEVYLLRWSAFRPDLYRIPYGGQHEAAMRAMQGWIIERPPFRGNGFAPAEDGQVIAEFKVDSIRLPHGAQMWRVTNEGRKTLIALLDADECLWRPVRGVDSDAVWDPAVPVVLPTPSVEAARSADDPLDPQWGPSRRRAAANGNRSTRARAAER